MPVLGKQGRAIDHQGSSTWKVLGLSFGSVAQVVTEQQESLDIEALVFAFKESESFVLEDVETRLIKQLENSNQIRQRTAAYLLAAFESLNAGDAEAVIAEIQVLQKKHRDLIENGDAWFANYLMGTAFQRLNMLSEARTFFSKSLMQAVSMSRLFYSKVSLWHLYEIEMALEHHLMAYEYLTEFERLCRHQELIAIIDTSEQVEEADTLQMAEGYTEPSSYWRWRASILFAIFLALFTLAGFFWNRSGVLAFMIPAAFLSRPKPPGIPLRAEESRLPLPMPSFKPNRKKHERPQFEEGDKSSATDLVDEEISVNEEKIDKLSTLRNMKLLTKEDWEQFMATFSEIYPDFLIRLHLKHTGVTQAEERLACLIRIHFVTRDISKTLGISAHSVNMSRYRLRKRLDLDTEVILEEYIMRL
ncbi:MAG: hypothetical protein ACK417_05790 [Bacteroidia bacterium]